MSLESNFLYGGNPASEAEDVLYTPEQESLLQIEQQSNYQGNWTELLYTRVTDPSTRQKFMDMKDTFPTEEIRNRGDALGRLEKFTDVPKDVYQKMIDEYMLNIQKVFSSTKYATSQNTYHEPRNLGISTGYGDEGLVLKDAVWDEKKLTPREKTIIEAHEKLHGLFMNLTLAEKRYILSPFDLQKISSKHKSKADEVLARMSQLKNYFGFIGGEKFTVQHLIYAAQHYVKDTGMDNNISNLFDSIEDIDTFLDVINTVAC